MQSLHAVQVTALEVQVTAFAVQVTPFSNLMRSNFTAYVVFFFSWHASKGLLQGKALQGNSLMGQNAGVDYKPHPTSYHACCGLGQGLGNLETCFFRARHTFDLCWP